NPSALQVCVLAVFFSPQRCIVIFFFSSRRRHTRSKRDWSSDVCSSDLRPLSCANSWMGYPRSSASSSSLSLGLGTGRTGRSGRRSEERRVGKEWRARGGSGDEDKRGKVVASEGVAEALRAEGAGGCSVR